MTPEEYTEYVTDLEKLQTRVIQILQWNADIGNLTPDDILMVKALFTDEIDSAKETFDSQQFLDPSDLERAHMSAEADYWGNLSPEDIEAVKQQLDIEEIAAMERNKIQ